MMVRIYKVGDRVIAKSRCPLRPIGSVGLVKELVGYGYIVDWVKYGLSPEYKREIKLIGGDKG